MPNRYLKAQWKQKAIHAQFRSNFQSIVRLKWFESTHIHGASEHIGTTVPEPHCVWFNEITHWTCGWGWIEQQGKLYGEENTQTELRRTDGNSPEEAEILSTFKSLWILACLSHPHISPTSCNTRAQLFRSAVHWNALPYKESFPFRPALEAKPRRYQGSSQDPTLVIF